MMPWVGLNIVVYSYENRCKVKGNKSPYDGDWTYWGNRIGKYPGMRKEVTTLLKRQKNKCAYCGLIFKPDDLMEIDHIKPKSKGGDNTHKNQQLLHRHCHDAKTALDHKKHPKPRSQDLPEGDIWVDDILILREGDVPMTKGIQERSRDEVKVSRPVLKTSRLYKGVIWK